MASPCEHVGSEADDATRGDVELDVRALALAFHRGHFALSARHHVNHLRGKFVGHVDGEFFDGFQKPPPALPQMGEVFCCRVSPQLGG